MHYVIFYLHPATQKVINNIYQILSYWKSSLYLENYLVSKLHCITYFIYRISRSQL